MSITDNALLQPILRPISFARSRKNESCRSATAFTCNVLEWFQDLPVFLDTKGSINGNIRTHLWRWMRINMRAKLLHGFALEKRTPTLQKEGESGPRTCLFSSSHHLLFFPLRFPLIPSSIFACHTGHSLIRETYS